MKKRFLVFIIFLLSGYILYLYVYKEHRNVATSKVSYKLNAQTFSSEFSSDYSVAEKKYLDKIIEISGSVTQISLPYLVLNTAIVCYLDNTHIENNMMGKEILIKGRFIGYDELLEEIKLDQCIIMITN